jgi:hypothetical protein
LELDKPDVFLKKLSGAIDQLVDEKWWIDKDKIRAKLDNEDQARVSASSGDSSTKCCNIAPYVCLATL